MSKIHIGPHTREDDTHGPGENHQTFDREIDLKSIGKWMGGLILSAVIIQVLTWWFIVGVEKLDERQDPELTPIQAEVPQKVPPAPRLQVTPGFAEHNPDSISRSDLEDMQILRETEDKVLGEPAWVDQGQGRLRVPIDVAMQVIVSRGAAGLGLGGAAAGTVTPEQMREQLPAGTSPGLPGATVQMARPQAAARPAQPNEQPAGAAQGQQQAAPRPPVSQEQ